MCNAVNKLCQTVSKNKLCQTSIYIKILLKNNDAKPTDLHLYNPPAKKLLNKLDSIPKSTTNNVSDAIANIDTVQVTYDVRQCALVEIESISLDYREVFP